MTKDEKIALVSGCCIVGIILCIIIQAVLNNTFSSPSPPEGTLSQASSVMSRGGCNYASAVIELQTSLMVDGYELGPTGIDGVPGLFFLTALKQAIIDQSLEKWFDPNTYILRAKEL